MRGTLRAHATGATDSARLASFMRNVIVELSQGASISRRAVDASGRFVFEGLHPGTWHLRIVNELPTDYALAENDTRKLDLQGGEQREVTLELLRKNRPIKMMEEQLLPTLQLNQ